jgi:2-aminoethylphosphonate-pyruvate transaminase
MRRLGFALYLDEAVQAPIIATFRMPAHRPLPFSAFYDALAARGFLLYPGKLTRAETFRIGCIGALRPWDFERLLDAVGETLTQLAPARFNSRIGSHIGITPPDTK